MNARQMFRVAVLGSPQAKQWLLVRAFAATRGRQYAYDLVAAAARQADMYVIDADDDRAMVCWAALDSRGTIPAAFLGRVHPRAKRALMVQRPYCSGSIVGALDRLAHRFLQVSDVNSFESLSVAREPALAAA